VVPELDQLLTSALVSGHIKCSLAVYCAQVELAIQTKLQNKFALDQNRTSSLCNVDHSHNSTYKATCIHFHVYLFIFDK
jgi:hypothetical protein